MMAHFEKLKTPLKAVEKYPTISAQIRRFQALGWFDILAQNLWSLFSSPDFLNPEERRSFDHVEPFDEWEEFALFGCHYILLVANTGAVRSANDTLPEMPILEEWLSSTVQMDVAFTESPKGYGCRRFAAGLPLKSSNRASTCIGNFAGMGPQTRVNTVDIYATIADNLKEVPRPHSWKSQCMPCARMCHSITDLGEWGGLYLLVAELRQTAPSGIVGYIIDVSWASLGFWSCN